MLRFTLIFTAFMCVVHLTIAQTSYKITASTFTIAGTSSLHDWESNATEVNATGQMQMENATLKAIDNLTVTIPVERIKSTKGSIMDNKTHKALESKSHPNITFKLTKINTLEKNGNAYTIKATGNLTIAGKAKAISLNVKGKMTGSDELQFDGSKALKMSDFGIDPPTALMGTLKTGDDITVRFSVKMAKSNVTGSR